MAKYLRPRRGTQSNARTQNFVLKSGEMFMEIPSGTMGKTPGRIILGDGSTAYSSLSYATTAATYQPFITDPSLYNPIFKNSTYATSDWTVNAATAAITGMGNGSGQVTLPTIIGKIKEALCKHEDSITALSKDLAGIDFNIESKASKSDSIKNITRNGTTFTATRADDTTFTFTQQDTNTTYSANNGIGLSGTTFFNAGVRSISSGSTNGTISVNTNGTAANVAVKGLGTAAYTASTAYAAASHTHSYLPLSGGTLTGNLSMNGSMPSVILASRSMFTNLNTASCVLCGDSGSFVRKYSNTNESTVMHASEFSIDSSRLIKENIKDIKDEYAKNVLKLRPVSFDYIEKVGGKKGQCGLIAEEVLEIYPECVFVPEGYTEEKAIDEIKNGSNMMCLSIDYSKFAPFLIKMIQLQQKEIDELKSIINKK